MEAGPRPFRQGDLDALCGAYAVVNAVRLAALPRRRLGRAACLELFAALVDELAEAGRLRAFVTGGMNTGTLARLLRRAKRWLDAEHGLALEVRHLGDRRHGRPLDGGQRGPGRTAAARRQPRPPLLRRRQGLRQGGCREPPASARHLPARGRYAVRALTPTAAPARGGGRLAPAASGGRASSVRLWPPELPGAER
jgi:hypothetical protein